MSERTKDTLINLLCLAWLFSLMLVVCITQNKWGVIVFLVGYLTPSLFLAVAGWIGGNNQVDKIVGFGYGLIYIGDSTIIALESIRYDIVDWRNTPKPKHKNFRY